MLGRALRCDPERVRMLPEGAQLLDPAADAEGGMRQSRARLIVWRRGGTHCEKGDVVIPRAEREECHFPAGGIAAPALMHSEHAAIKRHRNIQTSDPENNMSELEFHVVIPRRKSVGSFLGDAVFARDPIVQSA